MNEPRKPIFAFLWPSPDPNAPLDGAYRQVRGVRICPRGPIRIAVLVIATLVSIAAMGSMLMSALTMPLSALTLVGSALVALLLVAALRGWVVGTHVNDEGVVVETVLRRRPIPWTDVRGVVERTNRCPLLGSPVHVRARRLLIECTDGHTIATHVYSTSPDLWLRPEAFDMARLRLERWAETST